MCFNPSVLIPINSDDLNTEGRYFQVKLRVVNESPRRDGDEGCLVLFVYACFECFVKSRRVVSLAW